ncbi:hypothetical protein COCC4DRAFT_148009 [Bipolaris maydis ATCC 48331]|uniref:Uncharacterized protein n=2 Tax=Cochliobolus heterostrophus TaxID=5016 RepID=M2VCU7_COCH5|nr:uncharacterized protein COCC4DRAFT_148009 [Bipolaris maydis ATCC 48331]EMD97553.1 hypothetical protein COCHEDRAFT_1151191 [Bipolaris maydis C5]ENI01309.1 hypothetical protein COCC4DRAFT_148009 [Bipolaris maydis ATCC 48331]KAJ6211776.1 hypothetical protein PSV09DRAFT_1151191 [Bipolaris maydis]KAJ6274128.1 hypothetical protein PSV08DRAFT_174532 [Bipolaris maydis]
MTNVRALFQLCRTSRSLCDVAQPALYNCVRIIESATDPLLHLKLFLQLTLYNDRGLPRLPNLQHIHFTAQIEAPRALMHHIYEMQIDRSILSKLKTFHLHKQYEDGPLNIKDYISLMQFPCFEKFFSESDVPNTPDGSCAVNTLTHMTAELLWCLGPLSTMEALLQICPHLTVFKLIIADGTRYRWLQKLQTLYLDFHDYYNLRDPELIEEIEHLEDCVYIYPSSRDFGSLTHMAIEFEKLVRFRDLPMSLEYLDLSYCHFADLDRACLIDMIQLKGKCCPVIKSVVVRGWETTNEGINAAREHARSLDIPVHVAEDGRALLVQSGGYHLTIKSLARC